MKISERARCASQCSGFSPDTRARYRSVSFLVVRLAVWFDELVTVVDAVSRPLFGTRREDFGLYHCSVFR